ncbi:MAG: S8 family serine peptidase [Bacteroidales bacterium]|nr:S8 family serine peptidase [Bacteroidales bacterium]
MKIKKLIVSLWATLGCVALLAQTIDKYAVDGALYFKFKDNVELNYPIKAGKVLPENIPFLSALKDKYGITSVRNTFWQTTDPRLHRIFRVHFDKKELINDFIRDLSNVPEVEYAEKAPYFPIRYTPNDYGTNTDNTWHLDKISAKLAWDITQGSPNVYVAVIDNAIDVSHPDIAPKVHLAIDLGDGDNDPKPPQNTTIWSHGTHTSGLAVAATNNGTGISSIGFNCKLIAIKAGADADGGQGVSAMFEGITWAADNGAHIINMSFGGPSYFQTMQMIVDYAYNKGCVLVAAAGNNGDGSEDPNNVNYVGYPAACNHVIAVGATNGNDKKAAFSEFGTWIDVMAPGGYKNDGGIVDIMLNRGVHSTTAGNSYGKMVGTSMASPIVAGLCGLMKSVDPNLTPDRLTYLLKASCDNIESLQAPEHQGKIGAGRINAFKAVKMAQDSMQQVVANFMCSGNFINAGGYVNFTDLSVGNITSWNWSFPGGNPSSSTQQHPQNIVYSTPGTYPVTLTVSDGTHSSTETKTAYITVMQPAQSAWIEQASGFTSMYRGVYHISIVNENVVWGTAVDGTNGQPVKEFTRTTNGGTTWTPGTIVATGALAPAHICAVSDQKAWVAMYPTSGAGGKVYYTSDGGQTWTNQNNASMFTNSASFLNIVHFFNENEGFCMGDPVNNKFEIYYTTNGGQTWTAVDAANNPSAQSGEMGWTGVYAAYNNVAWFGTNKGRIYKTTDKGVTWQVYNTGLTDISDINFNNEMNGVALQKVYNTSTGAITSFSVKKTNDGGANWTTVNPSGPVWKSDWAAVPGVPGKYFSVGTDGGASGSAKYGSSYSLDYGASWTHIDTGVQYICVEFYNDMIGWAGGFSINATTSGIFKWDATSQVKPISEMVSVEIFPNPANNYLTVKSEDPIKRITIVNTLGQEVLSENCNAYQQILNVSMLSKGIYLIQIEHDLGRSIYRIIKE